jgi:5,10-methylene-tetrahydrofolate dehydrogenase/methenyl tetrahydrofolate cyclohydrolase
VDNINEQIKNNMKIELYNHQNELIGILLNFPFEENNQQLEESIVEYINENTDVEENEIGHYKVITN